MPPSRICSQCGIALVAGSGDHVRRKNGWICYQCNISGRRRVAPSLQAPQPLKPLATPPTPPPPPEPPPDLSKVFAAIDASADDVEMGQDESWQ